MRFRGLRTVAFDGCNSLKVPDTDRNRNWSGRIQVSDGLRRIPHAAVDDPGRDRHPWPARRHARLGRATGTRPRLARRLLPLLGPGMLLMLDRGFDASAFFAEIAAHRGDVLARVKSTRNPPVLAHLPDGSYLS